MSDNNKVAEQRANFEKANSPGGGPAPQSQTGYSWPEQTAYENEWKKKSQ
jgi:hypothetical protein